MTSFRVLVAVLPFLTVLSALAYRLGVAGSVVRAGSSAKEAVVALLVVVAGSRALRHRRRPDALDLSIVAFLVLATLYLLVPSVAGAGQAGTSSTFHDRLLGWRSEGLYLLLFLALRHLRPAVEQVAAAVRAFLLSASLVAGLAVVELVATSWWRRLLVEDLEIQRYLGDVLHLTAPRVQHLLLQLANRTTAETPRVGSVLLVPTTLAAALLVGVGFAVACGAGARSGRRRGAVAVMAVALLVGILVSQTRAVVAATVLVAALALWPEARGVRRRTLLVAAVASASVAAIAASTGLLDRFGDAGRSDSVHVERLTDAAATVSDDPLGRGLGTGYTADWGSGLRTVTENQYLNAGVQLGVAGSVLLVTIVVLAVHRLGAAAGDLPEGRARSLCAGARASLVGLAVVGVVSQPFAELVPAWCMWGLAGAALGAAERATTER